ncbi:MAG: TetR/AcrR family transcriptional regulator [Dermatophilaceae bacterium]
MTPVLPPLSESEPANAGPTGHDDKRTRILTAARAVLAEHGYDGAAMADVATRAGVAKGTVYLYFPSKAALVSALSAQVRDQLLAAVGGALSEDTTLAERLDRMVRAGVGVATAHRDVIRLLDNDMLLFTPTDRPAASRHEPLIAAFERAQQRGELSTDVDPDICAELVIAVVTRIAQSTLSGLVDDDERRLAFLQQSIAFLLRGLGLPPPDSASS